MRIPSAKTDQQIFFVAVDSTDHSTRKTGLSAFTVYRSRNGAAAVVYTTPTIVELSAANMPGVYALLVDEDTTIASTSDSEEYCIHITCATMAPVTRTIELYRNVWDVATTGHGTAGTFGEACSTTLDGLNAKSDNLYDLVDVETTNIDVAIAALPTANGNADALLDRVNGIETGYTLRQTIRLMSAVLAGKSSGHPGSPVYRNMPDTADRLTATVSSGNRSAVTLNP